MPYRVDGAIETGDGPREHFEVSRGGAEGSGGVAAKRKPFREAREGGGATPERGRCDQMCGAVLGDEQLAVREEHRRSGDCSREIGLWVQSLGTLRLIDRAQSLHAGRRDIGLYSLCV